jgi:hypothetical protein
MITKEEFLKAVEIINAYMEQCKEIKEVNKRHKVKDFYKWFFLNKKELLPNYNIHTKNRMLHFTYVILNYRNDEITYTDEIDAYYIEKNMKTSKERKKVFLDLIKQYENSRK